MKILWHIRTPFDILWYNSSEYYSVNDSNTFGCEILFVFYYKAKRLRILIPFVINSLSMSKGDIEDVLYC